jgi:oligopeptide/dipeptide ABC transporter ATP-binding protein
MYAGRVLEKGRTRQVLSDMRMPYTRGLFDSIPRIDAEHQDELRAIPGTPPDPTLLIPGCSFENRCSASSDICLESRPPWDSDGAGHEWTCWHPVTKGPEDDQAAR